MSAHKIRTTTHLAKADDLRASVVIALTTVPPPCWEIAIKAGAAATEYVDAYFWEYNWGAPADQIVRRALVGRLPALQPLRLAYFQLLSDASVIYYHESATVSITAAESAVGNLTVVETVIRDLLGETL